MQQYVIEQVDTSKTSDENIDIAYADHQSQEAMIDVKIQRRKNKTRDHRADIQQSIAMELFQYPEIPFASARRKANYEMDRMSKKARKLYEEQAKIFGIDMLEVQYARFE